MQLSNENFYIGNFYFVTFFFSLERKECNEFKGVLPRQLKKLKRFNECASLCQQTHSWIASSKWIICYDTKEWSHSLLPALLRVYKHICTVVDICSQDLAMNNQAIHHPWHHELLLWLLWGPRVWLWRLRWPGVWLWLQRLQIWWRLWGLRIWLLSPLVLWKVQVLLNFYSTNPTSVTISGFATSFFSQWAEMTLSLFSKRNLRISENLIF